MLPKLSPGFLRAITPKLPVITKFDDYGQVLEKTETTVEGAKTTVRATDKISLMI